MNLIDILTRHVTEFTARLIIADLIKAGVFHADPVVIDLTDYTVTIIDETETTQ